MNRPDTCELLDALPTGTYAVAVNPETRLWDLFVAAAAE